MRQPATATARPAASAPGVFDRQQRALTTGILLAITVVALEVLAVATVMPAAQRDLGGLRLYGWAFGGFMLASLVGIAWASREADRHGPARPLAVALAFFAAGLLIAGLAPSMLVLVIGRAIQGAGAGAMPAISYVAVGRGYPEATRPRMFALIATAWVVPGFAGPALAGVVAELASWRAVFVGLVPLLGLLAALTYPPLARLGPPATHEPPTGAGLVSALRVAVGAAGALAGLSVGGLWGASIAVAGLAVGLGPFRRLVPPGTLRAAPGIPAAIAGHGLLNLAFFGTEAFVPLMLTAVRGQSAIVAGIALTAATVAWTGGAWIQERAGERMPRRSTAMFGLLLLAAGCAGAAAGTDPRVPVVASIALWSVGGLGIGLAYQSYSLIVLAATSPGREGAAASSLKITEMLGAALGAGIAGVIVALDASDGPRALFVQATFLLMAALSVAGALTALRVGRAQHAPAHIAR